MHSAARFGWVQVFDSIDRNKGEPANVVNVNEFCKYCANVISPVDKLKNLDDDSLKLLAKFDKGIEKKVGAEKKAILEKMAAEPEETEEAEGEDEAEG